MTVDLARDWLHAGRLDLPLPGSGSTADRWRGLASLAETDLAGARIAEAHTDAVAILHELGGKPPDCQQLWGVWAAEGPGVPLAAERTSSGEYVLNGTKPWCSGATFCTHALVTARLSDGQRALFAVTVLEPAAMAMSDTWCNTGMARSNTRSVQFNRAHATMVGEPGEYLSRPGFWYGAIGVAACWLGGARAVAKPLYERGASEAADPHTLAHLGAVDAALAGAEATILAAAADIDRDPFDHGGNAQLLARRCRAVVEQAADEAIQRTGRALGPGPLCSDDRHAQYVADLTIYLRQSHAERDLADLGRLAAGRQ